MLLSYITSNKELIIPPGIVTNPGMITLSFALVTMDMIAEIYGYSIAKKILWISLIIQGVFCLLASALAYLPDPNNFHGPINWESYKQIFGILPKVYSGYFIGIVIGTLINTKLILLWKELLKGRWFWLRSIGASSIGNAIFLFIATVINGIGQYPFPLIIKFALANYFVEIVLLIILAPTANIVVYYIKSQTNQFLNQGVNFNPFAEDVNCGKSK